MTAAVPCASRLASVPHATARDATSADRPESALNAVAAAVCTMEMMTMCEDQNATSRTTDFQQWIERERADAEAEVRRLAKRDGIPTEAVEAILVKLRGERTGTA